MGRHEALVFCDLEVLVCRFICLCIFDQPASSRLLKLLCVFLPEFSFPLPFSLSRVLLQWSHLKAPHPDFQMTQALPLSPSILPCGSQ